MEQEVCLRLAGLMVESKSYDDALMHMRRLKAAGAFSVKSYNQERRDTRQMFLKAARELARPERTRCRMPPGVAWALPGAAVCVLLIFGASPRVTRQRRARLR